MFFGRDFPTRIYERWRLCEVGEHQRAAIAVPRFFRWRLEDTGEDHLSPLGVEAVDTRGTSCVTNWDMLFAGLHVCRMLGR